MQRTNIIYARPSTPDATAASTDKQVRVCRAYLRRFGRGCDTRSADGRAAGPTRPRTQVIIDAGPTEP